MNYLKSRVWTVHVEDQQVLSFFYQFRTSGTEFYGVQRLRILPVSTLTFSCRPSPEPTVPVRRSMINLALVVDEDPNALQDKPEAESLCC